MGLTARFVNRVFRHALAQPAEVSIEAKQPANDVWTPTRADASCDEAWAYQQCQAPRAAALAGRRGGKTTANTLIAAGNLARPGISVIYVSLIEKSAAEQFFEPLCALLEDHGWVEWSRRKDHGGTWHYKANHGKLIIRTKWGSTLRAFSAHDKRAAAAIRGYPADIFILDEAQEPKDDVVEDIMDRVALPFCIDRGGLLRMTGTTPKVEPCYFSKELDNPGTATFTWTSFDHDLPVPREHKVAKLKAACEARGKPLELHPPSNDNGGRWDCGPGTDQEIAAEFFAKRWKNPHTILYEFDPVRNGQKAPEGYCDRFSIGLDLAWSPDLVSINVRGWNHEDPMMRTWQMLEWADNKLPAVARGDEPSIAKKLKEVMRLYPPVVVVGDDGGHGAKITLATISNILGVEIVPKPRDLWVSVGLYNDEFRTGRAQIDKASITAAEVQAMRKIPNPNKAGGYDIHQSRRATPMPDGTEGKVSHKDHAAASRYAMSGCWHYWNQAAPEQPKSFWNMTAREQAEYARKVKEEGQIAIFGGGR